MNDLTVLFLTNNKVPQKWAEYHMSVLKKAVENYPVISISRIPIDFGTNILQTEPESKANIFRQLLRGAKLADTKWIAVAEDDTLYPAEHFDFRPDTFTYNMHRWNLYTWGEPVYSLKNYMLINSTMIAPRQMLIDTLEERFRKTDNERILGGEIGVIEKKIGATPVKTKEIKSINPIVQFDHDYFTKCNERETPERRHEKQHGVIKAYDIPLWGRAEALLKKFQ